MSTTMRGMATSTAMRGMTTSTAMRRMTSMTMRSTTSTTMGIAGRGAALCALLALALLGTSAVGLAAPQPPQERRLLTVDDLFELESVGDPRISPDGAWVAYTVSQMNAEKDDGDTDVWMVPLEGGEAIRLTTSDEPESSPRWSPDGRWLAFLSGRDGERTQVWLLPRVGGEAWRLTDLDSGVSSMEWSPDGRRLALVVRDPEEKEAEDEAPDEEGVSRPGDAAGTSSDDAAAERPRPIVVTRLEFKQDGRGYLDERRTHIYLFDVESRTATQITDGPYDDGSPAWSPDGRSLAFVSNRTEEPDSNENSDIFVVAAEAGAEPQRLTDWVGSDSSPAFSPDGAYVAYSMGGDPADAWYDTNDIALIAAGGGEPRILTEGLDRNVGRPRFTADGSSIVFAVEDHGSDRISRVPATGGALADLVTGERAVGTFDLGPRDQLVVLESQPDHPAEISRVESGRLSRLTHVNDDFLAGIELAPVRSFETASSGGVSIQGFLTVPPGAPEGEALPAILRIHGGPVSQFAHAFNFEWQLLAAHGYVVIAANPRGSSGRGRDFSHAIYADWGNVDFDDVMAAVDHAVAEGVADPDRLGVGGWSYGGILTNNVIVRTGRFKAAISGASEVNYTANYGHDHYQYIWEKELGLPWENTELWLRLSPFFHVANVTTPTLVMGGQADWNVPIQNSDQLYQALRRLGVPTMLVVYPGESHGISRPSFQKDRYERYLAWYDKWLKGEGNGTPARR